jgi:hypothetical protein
VPYRVVEARSLAPAITQLLVAAPLVVRKARAGQFVIVRVAEHGERIPLTIVDAAHGLIRRTEAAVIGGGNTALDAVRTDASGRARPIPVPGSERIIPVQTVIEAIGQKPNPIIPVTGLSIGRRGTVAVDERQRTSRPGVFAGGDIARGGATVILALRDGRRAAAAIHRLPSREDGLQRPAWAVTADARGRSRAVKCRRALGCSTISSGGSRSGAP